MIGYFISDQQSDYYQSKRFQEVLQFAKHTICKMKENPTGLRPLLTLTMWRILEPFELMAMVVIKILKLPAFKGWKL
jgi:hypothetical protein